MSKVSIFRLRMRLLGVSRSVSRGFQELTFAARSGTPVLIVAEARAVAESFVAGWFVAFKTF
jgi:hypothetical protein